ncbi:class I SAM-dependent methyltransferase [Leptospira licerasiae]|uniref:Methyltransferase, UbiE/COQ5 family n=1 Tax=Leptospira licerasiae str. MMD4847 TaxID=1049971 RepID=A0ABN0H7P0_9LEPT|nr:class I SAM-dependent methyltransferase [Leptospira licerasiae]EID99754.1 methyltransferase, UbiE/COQ5 family [Leptospira licerasiae serovar Varillal str. VAR 010]EJZ41672.1 methyltransferase, UbiE/COQ5 family [Leptospira licerasiae str. MMD4847]
MTHVEKFEGERAQVYERRIGKMIPFYSGIMELVAIYLLENTPEKGKILSVGCGTGADFSKLLKIFPDRFSITGLDPSPEMIEQARKKFPQLKFICGTVGELPPAEEYDSATLLFVLHFLPDTGDKLSLLKEICSRLKKGGSLILFDLFDPQTEGSETLFKNIKSYLINFQGWEEEAVGIYLKRVFELHRIGSARYTELFQEAGFSEYSQKFRSLHVGGWIATK